jgi:hypothetical protein
MPIRGSRRFPTAKAFEMGNLQRIFGPVYRIEVYELLPKKHVAAAFLDAGSVNKFL